MDRCIHDFLPGQCATCQNHVLGDENKEKPFYFGGLLQTTKPLVKETKNESASG